MRKKIVVGNWKMNKTIAEAVELSSAIIDQLGEVSASCEVGIAPAFPALSGVHGVISGTGIHLAAQNCHYEDDGAFTGEVSVRMLDEAGCSYVIVGHSERRQYFGDTNPVVNLKVKKALSAGLNVILCVGETLDEREKGITTEVVTCQVKEGLEGVADIGDIVIAYEPVWAIGTGKTASSLQAQEVHASIRATVAGLYSEPAAAGVRIQYGGSVKPSNAEELFAMPDIDGGLIGGASLNAEDFVAIVKAAEKS
ncbi:Triose-phosphate isomerase [Prosthecochloris aestuarii DSM 271]|uniref:Triosephosphate isomerase n=1 Tax=Prosthecochloris aestuarii (strain DSM 271 / SK 413) TaxID=290512 RepID=TPIS_PROA2|nr:triose-phosphate isomerase [Prosthecochloris aestuarii]B4S9B0.1 RecName: Full=Triosephosphate isomerase; Short=TIM; Short=TPI; AltName: Full=Triose-phosphate isomerase [Prosthecochloris aestuarii DSM 271]ACF46580.1 Triose-phosphate isomerase [Prosthecochloris aestuarii DSM 271]